MELALVVVHDALKRFGDEDFQLGVLVVFDDLPAHASGAVGDAVGAIREALVIEGDTADAVLAAIGPDEGEVALDLDAVAGAAGAGFRDDLGACGDDELFIKIDVFSDEGEHGGI